MKPKTSRIFAVSQVALCLTALPVHAVDFDNGGGDLKWSTPANWTGDAVPGGNNVFINEGVANNWTIALDYDAPAVNEIGLLRNSNGGVVTVNQTDGTLQVNSWFNLAQGWGGGGGTATWNMSGDSVLNSTHSSGGLTVIGVGFASTPAYDKGILNISGDAWFNQTAAAIHVGGEGAGSRAKGVINLSNNGKLTNTSTLLVGAGANGSTGVVNLSGNSTLTASQFYLGTNNGATGAINQSGGAASTTVVGANTIGLGNAVGGFGSYRISGGTLSSNEIGVGASTGGSGMLDISGGAVTNGGWLVLNRTEGTGSQAQSAILNVSAGSLTYNGGGLVANWGSSTTNTQTAAITVSGTGSISTGNGSVINLGWGNNSTNVGVLNLNGGTVTPSRIIGNRSFVNFNGGVLRANNDEGNFIAVTSAQVRSGGAIIDTNGKNVTISQALLAPSDSGVTTIAVTDGGSGYISAPILKIEGGTGSGATAVANMVDDGSGNGTFKIGSITVTGAGNYTVAPTTIGQTGGGAGTTATFGAIATATNTSGGLTKNGNGTLTLTGANTFTGAVEINGGTLYANAPNASNGRNFSYVSGITVNNGATLRSNANSLFGWGGTQDKSITVKAGGVLTADSGADVGVGTVILEGGELANLGPSTVWGSWRFDNAGDVLRATGNSTVSAVNVKFANGGAIDVAAGKTLDFTGTITNSSSGGVSSVVKNGTGTLTITGNSTYTGNTAVSAGTLLVNGSLGDTAVTVASGAKLGGSGTVGTGIVLNTFTVNGELAPGTSPGQLTINDNLDLNGALTMELNGVNAGTTYDQILLNGTGDLGGTLALAWGLTSAPAVNTELLLILNDGADALSGAFNNAADLSLLTDNLGGQWQLRYSGGSGNDLSLVAVPEPRAALLGGLGLLALLRRRK